jgi:uncharacterized membrane protein YeaQ/YmgE (transglycosylase-associated protein family)
MKLTIEKLIVVRRFVRAVMAFVAVLTVLGGQSAFAADESSVGEKAKEVVKKTSSAVQSATSSAAEQLKDLWRRIDPGRLENRTRDELVAWVIMGLLAGALAGMMAGQKATGLGKFGRLLLGLVGAFLGGLVVNAGKFDFGWGPVLIRYEELFFAFVGAIVLLLVVRMIRSRSKKSEPSKEKESKA